MGSKVIKSEQLLEKLSLTECTDGYWLYDGTRGMNLAVKAKTPTEALVDALEYYQDKLSRVESEYRDLRSKVDKFLVQFEENDEH